jgi:hypothetical protein
MRIESIICSQQYFLPVLHIRYDEARYLYVSLVKFKQNGTQNLHIAILRVSEKRLVRAISVCS